MFMQSAAVASKILMEARLRIAWKLGSANPRAGSYAIVEKRRDLWKLLLLATAKAQAFLFHRIAFV